MGFRDASQGFREAFQNLKKKFERKKKHKFTFGRKRLAMVILRCFTGLMRPMKNA